MIETSALKTRVLNVLIAIDQLAWVIVTLGKGKPDETISAAMWRMEQEGKLAGRVFDRWSICCSVRLSEITVG